MVPWEKEWSLGRRNGPLGEGMVPWEKEWSLGLSFSTKYSNTYLKLGMSNMCNKNDDGKVELKKCSLSISGRLTPRYFTSE